MKISRFYCLINIKLCLFILVVYLYFISVDFDVFQLYVANKMSLAMQQPFNTFYETGTAAEVGGCKYATNLDPGCGAIYLLSKMLSQYKTCAERAFTLMKFWTM